MTATFAAPCSARGCFEPLPQTLRHPARSWIGHPCVGGGAWGCIFAVVEKHAQCQGLLYSVRCLSACQSSCLPACFSTFLLSLPAPFSPSLSRLLASDARQLHRNGVYARRVGWPTLTSTTITHLKLCHAHRTSTRCPSTAAAADNAQDKSTARERAACARSPTRLRKPATSLAWEEAADTHACARWRRRRAANTWRRVEGRARGE